MVFSIAEDIRITLHKKGWFTIENYETVEDAETKSIIAGFFVKGRVEFIAKKIKEEDFVSMKTEGADMEVRSKHFYVDSTSYNTVVECYEGKLLLTDSISLKTQTLEAGYTAEIFSSNGEKNTSVRVYPTTKSKRPETQ
jgi:hypothetical protein